MAKAKAVTEEEVQQRQMETRWLADPIMSKWTWGPSAMGSAAAWGHLVCPSPGKGQAAVLMLWSRKPNSLALQPGPGLVLGTGKQRTWDKGAMRLIPAAPGASLVLAGGAGASGSVQAPPQPSHHFCPAPWVVMRCGGRQEGTPDLAQGVCLTSLRRRDRRCQGWQALQQEHSQGVINNLLSQGGLLGFKITRHRCRVAQMDPPHSYFLH